MHHTIAAWLTERPWRAAVAAALCGALSLQMPFILLAGAIPVLVALRFDARLALAVAATALAAAAWVGLSVAPDALWIVIGLLAVIFVPVLLGLLLKHTGSLNLCFQVAVAGVSAAVVAVYAVLSGSSRRMGGSACGLRWCR